MHVLKHIFLNGIRKAKEMNLKQITAQVELMHKEALRKSAEYEDKWLNTFHGGRESALASVLKLLKEQANESD